MPWIGGAIGGALGLLGSSMGADAAEDAAATSAAASRYAADIQKQMYDQTRADQTPWRNAGSNALTRLSYLMGLQDPTLQTPDQMRQSLIGQYTTKGTPAGQRTPIYSGTDIWNPIGYTDGTAGTPDVVDENGLNAAIQRLMASQQAPKGADFGSLGRSFGMSDFQADPGYKFRMDEGINALQGRAAAKGGLKSGNTLKALMEYGQNLGSQEYNNAYSRFTNDQNTQFNRLSGIAGTGQTANNALQNAGQNYANSVGNLTMGNAANQGNAMLAGANARMSGYNALGEGIGKYFANQSGRTGNYGDIYGPTGYAYDNGWGW